MLFSGEVWPFCFDWFTVIFRVGILLWFVVCLVLQNVSEEEWKWCNCCYVPIVDEKRETVIWACEKNECNEKKEKCFPVLLKRKTLFFIKVVFSVLTGIKFPLTSFPCCCQTWENKESEFQEFTFLQSNTAEGKREGKGNGNGPGLQEQKIWLYKPCLHPRA